MTPLHALLEDVRRLAAIDPGERRRATSQLARELGADWAAGAPIRGEISLPLRHRPTGLAFVAIPGGEFEMGLSDVDVEEASEYVDWSADVARWIDAMIRQARPVHHVVVHPFVVARRPLFTSSFRLLSEAEFEWLARDGGQRAFTADAGRRYRATEDAADHRQQAKSRFGLELLDASHWVADDWHGSYEGAPGDSISWLGGDLAGVRRSGFFFAAMQCADELLGALAAARFRGGEACMLRLACDLP